jgi:uncharacterized protein (TIGR00369 family)
MFEPLNPDFKSEISASFASLVLMRTIGAKLVRVAAGEVEIELPFRDDLTQQHGFIAAAIIAAILDVASGYAAMSLMPPGAGVITVEFKVNLLAPAVGERFIARGRVTRSGRTLSVCAAKIFGVAKPSWRPPGLPQARASPTKAHGQECDRVRSIQWQETEGKHPGSPHGLPWSRQRRSAPVKLPTGMGSPAVPPERVDELLGISGQEPLGLPRDPQPAADGRPALEKGNAANAAGRNDDRGGNHRDAIAGTRQGDGRVRSAALEEHAWPNARNPAGRLEPVARSKFAAQQQKRFLGEFGDLDGAAAA